MSAQVTEAHRVLARHLSTEAESVPHLCDLMAQAIADSEARTIAAAVAPLEARIKSDEELFHDIRMKLTASCGDPYKLHDEALDAIIAERDQLRAELARIEAAKPWLKEANATVAELRVDVERWELAFQEQYARAESAEREVERLRDIGCVETLLRAERAEAELDGIRALADRRNKRYHVEDTTHQLVAALDQALDIAQAELAQFRELDAERARMRQIAVDKRIRTPTPRADKARLDWLEKARPIAWALGSEECGEYWILTVFAEKHPEEAEEFATLRAAIDAAMKEETK